AIRRPTSVEVFPSPFQRRAVILHICVCTRVPQLLLNELKSLPTPREVAPGPMTPFPPGKNPPTAKRAHHYPPPHRPTPSLHVKEPGHRDAYRGSDQHKSPQGSGKP